MSENGKNDVLEAINAILFWTAVFYIIVKTLEVFFELLDGTRRIGFFSAIWMPISMPCIAILAYTLLVGSIYFVALIFGYELNWATESICEAWFFYGECIEGIYYLIANKS